MTTGGWIVMALSVGTVCTLFVWCMIKVTSTPGETERMKGIVSKTPDEED